MADNQVGELWVKISADLKNFGSQISGEMAKMDNAIKQQVGGSMNKLKQALESNREVFQGLATTGAVAFGAISVGMSKAIDSASGLNESVNAVKVVFGDASNEILNFGKTASTQIGLSKQAFNELATPIGALLTNSGVGMQEVTKNTIELSKRASDMASIFNVDVKEALQAIQSGLRGEADPLERFGVGLNETAVKAYAVKAGLASAGQEMTQQQKTLARLGLFYEQTAKLEGDFANTSNQLANSQRILSAEMKNLSADMGQLFLPIQLELVNAIRPLVDDIKSWSQANPELAKNIGLVALSASGLAVAVGAIGLVLPPVIAGMGLISAPLIAVIAVLGALALAWATDFGGIRAKTQEVIDFIKPYITDGIEKVKEVIKSGLTFVKTFWETRGEDIKNFVIDMGEKIINYIKPLLKSMMEIFSSGLAIIGEGFELFTNLIKGNRSGAWDNVKNILTETLNILKNALRGFFAIFGVDLDGMVAKIKSVFGSVAQSFKDIFADMKKFVNSVVDAVSKSIESIKASFTSSIKVIQNAIGKIKEFLGLSQEGGLRAGGLAGARADGGPVLGGGSYLVGERGPEIFMPKVSGTIIPDFNRMITALQKPSQTQSYPDNRSNFNNRQITIQNQNTIDVNDLSRLLHRYL